MISFTLVLTSILAVIFLWFYLKINKIHRTWSDLGIPGPKPRFLIGNGLDIIRNSRAEIDSKWARQYGSIYGYYMGVFPNLVITDPELVKQVFVKDFPHFVNRLRLNAYHELWNTNLLLAEDEDWKRIRTIVTPAFTSGKLKSMQGLMSQCIEKLSTYLNKVAAKEGGGIITDTKQVFSGFAIDIIASTSFGTETNANGDRETEDPLVHNGRELFKVRPLQTFTALALPRWFNNLVGNKTLFRLAPFEFFISLMREIVKQRKGHQKTKTRPDLVQLMIDAAVDEQAMKEVKFEQLAASNEEGEETVFSSSGKQKSTLSDNEIIASSILFFNAGFETTSGTIVHCCFEMAKNPEVQERLYQKIVAATEGLEPRSEEFFDVVVNRLPYLEATIMETLRLYPPIAILLRRLKTDGYVLAGHRLPFDTTVEVATYYIHHNEAYYPDPESFQPERFLPENKHKLVPYTFLPFGSGPRNCVGMRFALQEIKLCFATILKQFRFERAPGTPDAIEFGKGAPLLLSKTFPLKIVKRQ